MEIFKLIFKGQKFKLSVNDPEPRFKNEGIIQAIRLSVDNHIVYMELFGWERALNNFKSEIYEFIEDGTIYMSLNYKTKTILFEQPFDKPLILTGDDFDFIINWIITGLTPLDIKRKHKINEIKSKLF